ncbi:MAG: hypothetical protein EOO09_17585 [Chitinophagaceae bacterium]|nr:MAG: hypothetical protein EOO09_17585 [Chitinophagaceae bacterium]
MKDFLKMLGLVAVFSLVRAAIGLHNYEIGIDDTNIYFVYVRNLHEGHGFVYYPGGPHVEGFTSFLWTLFLTLVYSIRFLPFETTVLVSCLLITASIVYLYFRFVKARFGEIYGWFIALFLVLTPGFIDWNVFSLMDLPLWILSVSWALLLLIDGGRKKLFTVIVVLLPFIRPEGLLLSGALVVLRMFREYAAGLTLRRAILSNLVALLAVVTAIVIFTLFRIAYFGYPFPNTFYAKVSVSLGSNIKNGVFYFYDTVRHTSLVPAVLLAISLVTIIRRRYWNQWRAHAGIIVLVLVAGFFLVYPFLTGGDHFRYSRFFQPLFPLTALLAMLLFQPWLAANKTRRTLVLPLLLVWLNLNSTDITSFRESFATAAGAYFSRLGPDLVRQSQLQSEFDIAVYGRSAARHMNEVLSACDSLPSYGVVAAGGTAYMYKGEIVDVMGLNNPEMAHADRIKAHGVKNHGSFNKQVFYRQAPDLFLSYPDPLTSELVQTDANAMAFLTKLRDPAYFINRVCQDIFNDPDFKGRYRYSRISNGAKHFYGFVRTRHFETHCPGLTVTALD